MAPVKPNEKLTTQEGIPLTEEQRLQKCGEAINQALAAYGCELRVFPQFTTEGRVVASAQLTIKQQ